MNLTIEDARRIEHALIVRANRLADLSKRAKSAAIQNIFERASAEHRRLAAKISTNIDAASGDIISFDLD